MTLFVHNCTPALLARAERALRPEYVFYFRNQIFEVARLSWHRRTLELTPLPRSIDDCTPAEWDAAARAARETC